MSQSLQQLQPFDFNNAFNNKTIEEAYFKALENKDSDLKDPLLDLMSSFDARDWAREFVKIIKEKPQIVIDEEFMLTWFSSALMRGYDEHAQRMRRVTNLITEKRGL